MSIRDIQVALQKDGLNPGPVDGIWGPKTRSAMQTFQITNKLIVSDTPNSETLAALFPRTTNDGDARPILWLEEAYRLIGVREISGPKSNPLILDWANDLDTHYPSDDIAWCGLFVAHCIRSALPDEDLPANILGARQYEKFGHKCDPQQGAVGVFWRKSKESGFGHVGFLIGERTDAYQVLGGNQSDSISMAWVSKSRFLQARWPVTFSPETKRPLARLTVAGNLSVKED